MFRIIDLETGRFLDLTVADYIVQAFRDQLERDNRRTKRAGAFVERLEYRIELAIRDSIDSAYEPPFRDERVHVVVVADRLQLCLPPDALRFRKVLHRFLRQHSAFPSAELPWLF